MHNNHVMNKETKKRQVKRIFGGQQEKVTKFKSSCACDSVDVV